MFKQIALVLGLSMTAGSGFVGYDYNRQSTAHGDATFSMMLYLENMVSGGVDQDAQGHDTRRASLPQARTPAKKSHSEWGIASGEDELRAMAPNSPQIQQFMDREDAHDRASVWARIRHKIMGPSESGQGRLAGIHDRGKPDSKYENVSPWSLMRMGPMEQYKNREAIGAGFSNFGHKKKDDGPSIVWKK